MSDVYKKKDLVGKRFGMLTVMEDSGMRSGNSILWRCRCDCGGEILAERYRLQSGTVTNCGCRPEPSAAQISDLIGKRFGMLTVEKDSGKRSGGCILWNCKCDCGNEILLVRSQLVSGKVQSCGCVPECHISGRMHDDLTGKQFGELTVMRQAGKDRYGHICWACLCSCGKECTVASSDLKSGNVTSCGCKRHASPVNKRDLAGQRFGRLVALYPAEKENNSGKTFWHCRCDCGNEVDVNTMSLVRGRTRSCGCYNAEQDGKLNQYLHLQDNTCIERLRQIHNGQEKNRSGFRGLFLTQTGKYRATITFQGVHYHLGLFLNMADAIRARLDAEAVMHDGYIKAYDSYIRHAEEDPEWAESNPFYYRVTRAEGDFRVATNG